MINTFFVWDLGGTKCSAGIIEHNTVSNKIICKKKTSVKLAETTSLEDLIFKLEDNLKMRMSQANAICIGAAGLYDGETLILEGVYPYPMRFAAIAKAQCWPHYAIIHDYASIICSTFTNYMDSPQNVLRLNDSPIDTHGRRVAFGIGTGLGGKDGVLFPDGSFWLGRNEIGHIGVTTPPMADQSALQRHHELIHFLYSLETSHHPITFEKILSGPGTSRLHQFFYPSQGVLSPEEVGINLREGKASELLNAFAWYTGLFVGTIQLMFMPEGGIWITGGVALNHLEIFQSPEFFAGINASPAYILQREKFPLGVLCNLEHALIGCGYYAANKLFKTNFQNLAQNKVEASQ
ncbi:MAG: glucokinase [Gammaproteobacteria bacterium]|nr:glucokinase [Gammaproteobacteria bacterium]